MNRNGAEQNWRDLGDVMVFEWKLQAYSYSHEFLQLSHVRGVQLLPVSEFPSAPATGPPVDRRKLRSTNKARSTPSYPPFHSDEPPVRQSSDYLSLFVPAPMPSMLRNGATSSAVLSEVIASSSGFELLRHHSKGADCAMPRALRPDPIAVTN